MTDFVIVRSATRRATDPAFKAYVQRPGRQDPRPRARHTVQTVTTPYQTGDPDAWSPRTAAPP